MVIEFPCASDPPFNRAFSGFNGVKFDMCVCVYTKNVCILKMQATTKQALLEKAKELGIKGRWSMKKSELETAIAAKLIDSNASKLQKAKSNKMQNKTVQEIPTVVSNGWTYLPFVDIDVKIKLDLKNLSPYEKTRQFFNRFPKGTEEEFGLTKELYKIAMHILKKANRDNPEAFSKYDALNQGFKDFHHLWDVLKYSIMCYLRNNYEPRQNETIEQTMFILHNRALRRSKYAFKHSTCEFYLFFAPYKLEDLADMLTPKPPSGKKELPLC